MKISTSIHMFDTDYPVNEAIKRCVSAGFEALDFNYTDYMPSLVKMSWAEEERWAQNVREAAVRHGVEFTQMHGPIHGPSFDQIQHGLDLDSFLVLAERSLRTASILGVPWVVFHPSNMTLQGSESYSEQMKFNNRVFSRLLPVTEETGVGIALENMSDRPKGTGRPVRSYCGTPEELVELIHSLKHSLYGACWDTGHGHLQGLNQGHSIRVLGSLLKAVHIQDSHGVTDEHMLPFQGSIVWKDVLEGLASVGYHGDFTYETFKYFRAIPLQVMDSGLVHAVATARYLTTAYSLEATAQ
jgi:sugar phosphate isomerase/epimerase